MIKTNLSDFEAGESDFHSMIADQADQAHGQDTLRSAHLHNDFLSPILSLPENSLILDVACGTGVDLIHVAQKGFCIAGIDIAPGMVKIAADKTQESRLQDRIGLYVSSAYQLPFRDLVLMGPISVLLYTTWKIICVPSGK